MVSKIPQLEIVNSADYFSPMLDVFDSAQPFIKNIRCLDLIFHTRNVACKRQNVKQKLTHLCMMSFGKEAELLEPEEMKQEIEAELREFLEEMKTESD